MSTPVFIFNKELQNITFSFKYGLKPVLFNHTDFKIARSTT